MGEELAAFEASPSFVDSAVRTAALAGDGTEPHDEMLVRVRDDIVETPASAADSTQTSYCTLHADAFEVFTATQSVVALFPVSDVLGWLDWLDVESTIRVAFVGEPGAKVASELRLTGEDAAVTLDCVDDPTLFDDVEFWLPDRFRDGQFLTADGGRMPTRVETTVAELERLVTAVEQTAGVESYPVSVSGGLLELTVEGETSTVRADLQATVEGPGVTHQLGQGFARVVRTLDGEVTLQTGPGEPLAVVHEADHFTLRFVLQPV